VQKNTPIRTGKSAEKMMDKAAAQKPARGDDKTTEGKILKTRRRIKGTRAGEKTAGIRH
jgi:hypothetical protein